MLLVNTEMSPVCRGLAVLCRSHLAGMGAFHHESTVSIPFWAFRCSNNHETAHSVTAMTHRIMSDGEKKKMEKSILFPSVRSFSYHCGKHKRLSAPHKWSLGGGEGGENNAHLAFLFFHSLAPPLSGLLPAFRSSPRELRYDAASLAVLLKSTSEDPIWSILEIFCSSYLDPLQPPFSSKLCMGRAGTYWPVGSSGPGSTFMAGVCMVVGVVLLLIPSIYWSLCLHRFWECPNSPQKKQWP